MEDTDDAWSCTQINGQHVQVVGRYGNMILTWCADCGTIHDFLRPKDLTGSARTLAMTLLKETT